jgi:hypothetical protein
MASFHGLSADYPVASTDGANYFLEVAEDRLIPVIMGIVREMGSWLIWWRIMDFA